MTDINMTEKTEARAEIKVNIQVEQQASKR